MQIITSLKEPVKLTAEGGQVVTVPKGGMVVILNPHGKGVASTTGKMALLENTGGWQFIDPAQPDLKMNLCLGRRLPGGGRLQQPGSGVEVVGQEQTTTHDNIAPVPVS